MSILHNRSFYVGDNLEIMRTLPSDVIDLIYLDPPFNTGIDYYGVKGTISEGISFSDIFNDDQEHIKTYKQELFRNNKHLETDKDMLKYKVKESLRHYFNYLQFTIDTNRTKKGTTEYMLFITPRLLECHRLLKKTGSFFLHCDINASHYLKTVLDIIFGGVNKFKHQIIWKRKTSMGHPDHMGNVTDVLLYYRMSSKFTYNQEYIPQNKEYLDEFKQQDKNGKFRTHTLLVSGRLKNTKVGKYEYKGYVPPRDWLITKEALEKLEKEDRVYWSKKGRPRRKMYVHESLNKGLSNLWTDIPNVQKNTQTQNVFYPTQKPLKLLERIIKLSTNKGDLVLDPFAGSGTTSVASELLQRKWIAIEKNPQSFKIVKHRFRRRFKGNSSLDRHIGETKKEKEKNNITDNGIFLPILKKI